MSIRSRREEAVSEALSKHASAWVKAGPARWLFELVNGTSLLVEGRMDEDWLHLRASPDLGISGAVWWKLLQLNAGLSGTCKFVLPARERSAELCAEIPMGPGIDVASRVREACSGLKQAIESLEKGTSPSTESAPAITAADGREDQAVLEEAGWSFTERSNHYLVALEVPGEFRQARVESRYTAIEVGNGPFSEISKRACGFLLLSASGVVRNARAAVHTSEESDSVRFEVRFGAPPSSVELHHALASLSVASRLYGREVRALQNEDVARTYVDVLGG